MLEVIQAIPIKNISAGRINHSTARPSSV